MSSENQAADTAPKTGTFIWLAIAGTSFGLGMMLASLAALETTPTGFRFAWNLWVWLAFFVGAGLGALYWWTALGLGALESADPAKARTTRRRFKAVSAVLILAAVFAFLYPMKIVRPEKRDEVRAGLLMVPFFVVPCLTGWYLVKRFLDRDTARADAEENG